MIMRMTWGKLRAGSWQEYEQAYRATVTGTEVPGLRGRWLAQDVHDPDGGFAVSLWESLEPDFDTNRYILTGVRGRRSLNCKALWISYLDTWPKILDTYMAKMGLKCPQL